MKTYLYDTFHRYKRFSEELDAKTILCNKSWWVFNDSGEKEVYIFNTDGTLIISVSGRVTNATWQYIAANKSLIITGNNQSYMVHPAFYDNSIFALQVDGTNHYAFLIDENNMSSTNMRSFADLKNHFAEKERQAELEEERKRQAAIEAQRQREIAIERQKYLVAEEIRREKSRRQEEALNDKVYEEYIYILFPLAIIETIFEKLSFMRNNNFFTWTFLAFGSEMIALKLGYAPISIAIALGYTYYFILFVMSKIAILCLNCFNLYDIAFNIFKKKYRDKIISEELDQ